jgi:peptide deformylase
MAVVDVIDYFSDPDALRRTAKPVTFEEMAGSEFLAFVEDLRDTMLWHKGFGLASTQVRPEVAEPPRVFAMRWQGGPIVVVNPEVTFDARREWGSEACLSFRSVRALLSAPIAAEVRGTDERGAELEFRVRGVGARCAWHESRHLDGKLMIDEMRGSGLRKFLRDVGKARQA